MTPLTPLEKEVQKFKAEGLTVKVIAARMRVSQSWVYQTWANVRRKTGQEPTRPGSKPWGEKS